MASPRNEDLRVVLGGPQSEKSDLRAAAAALIATSLSYLGVSTVALWLFECRRSLSLILLAALLVAAYDPPAAFRYLTGQPPAREDWRGAMARIDGRLGSQGVLLAFPFHQAAVAALAYALRARHRRRVHVENGPPLLARAARRFRRLLIRGPEANRRCGSGLQPHRSGLGHPRPHR